MERRVAKTWAASATATLAIAAVTIAALEGGMFAAAEAPARPGVKTVEVVDDYIVVHSPTTTTTSTLAPAIEPEDPTAGLTEALEVQVVPVESTDSSTVAPLAASTPDPAPATQAPIRPNDDSVEDDSPETDHHDDEPADEHRDNGSDQSSDDGQDQHHETGD